MKKLILAVLLAGCNGTPALRTSAPAVRASVSPAKIVPHAAEVAAEPAKPSMGPNMMLLGQSCVTYINALKSATRSLEAKDGEVRNRQMAVWDAEESVIIQSRWAYESKEMLDRELRLKCGVLGKDSATVHAGQAVLSTARRDLNMLWAREITGEEYVARTSKSDSLRVLVDDLVIEVLEVVKKTGS